MLSRILCLLKTIPWDEEWDIWDWLFCFDGWPLGGIEVDG